MPSSSIKKSNKKSQLSHSSTKKPLNKQRSQCSSVTKSKLIEFLLNTSQIQRKIEIIKQMLCQEQQFTPASLFHRIDKSRKGFIIQKDIQDFLNDQNVKVKGSQLKILFGKINTNQNNAGINMRQFQNFILPNQAPKLRYLTMRRPIYIPLQNQKLSEKIEWITRKLFLQIINQLVKLMDVNIALISSFDFKIQDLFDMLGNQNGFITAESLNYFLNFNNQQLKMEQIGCLIKIIDKKGQGRVHFDDFKYFMATLGLKKEHQIFDELSPIPALKNVSNSQLTVIKNRDETLLERYKDNKQYAFQFQKKELQRSRKTSRLSRSRKNY